MGSTEECLSPLQDPLEFLGCEPQKKDNSRFGLVYGGTAPGRKVGLGLTRRVTIAFHHMLEMLQPPGRCCWYFIWACMLRVLLMDRRTDGYWNERKSKYLSVSLGFL